MKERAGKREMRERGRRKTKRKMRRRKWPESEREEIRDFKRLKRERQIEKESLGWERKKK
jgi:hypothetical protein